MPAGHIEGTSVGVVMVLNRWLHLSEPRQTKDSDAGDANDAVFSPSKRKNKILSPDELTSAEENLTLHIFLKQRHHNHQRQNARPTRIWKMMLPYQYGYLYHHPVVFSARPIDKHHKGNLRRIIVLNISSVFSWVR